jgi:hypothetical protein
MSDKKEIYKIKKTRKIIKLRDETKTKKLDDEIKKIFRNRNEIKECLEEDNLKQTIKEESIKRREKKLECDQKLYSFITNYFDPENSDKSKIINLIEAIYKLYKEKKEENLEYKLTLEEFILMFPRDTSTGKFNFRRQHVFEALCMFMLLRNYDRNYWGKEKIFYKSLEDYIKGNTNIENENILNKDINDGSSAQSVDIFFKIPSGKIENKELKDEPSCNIIKKKQYEEVKDDTKKDLFILIQNKFYDEEKSSADKYDITKIATRAMNLTNEAFEDVDKKIILMVNSKESLDKKISASRNKDFNLVNEIFGLKQLDAWFQNMLYDIYKSKELDDFIKIDNNKDKPSLNLRFHQDIFCETTNKYLNNEDEKERYKKFIWGAVPRSGKSYMIAGMINKRILQGSNNDILIILGAKSETEEQFYDIFKDLDNFDNYGIIKVSQNYKKHEQDLKEQNIFITSQEKFKINKQSYKQYKKLFQNKKIDIYFDEIHKGGSSKEAKKIIDFLIEEKFTIDLFVMVTATYAKPIIAYTHAIDSKKPIVLNWSYEDQQLMKQITNDVKLSEFKQTRNNDLEREIIDKLLNDYRAKYGKDYLKILEDEYKRHPELVIIQPFIETTQEEVFNIDTKDNKKFNIHGNVFKLSCDAISDNLEVLQNPTKIFHDNNAVIKLLDFIGKKNTSNTLSEDCIYGKLTYQYNYDIINRPHSELWFLPDKSLYDNPGKCKELMKEKGLEIKKIDVTEGEQLNYDDNTIKDKGLPNIEPLTRGLVLNMLNITFFKENYCFLIVHNQKITYYDGSIDNTNKVFKDDCVKLHSQDGENITTKIKQFERETYRKGKSLIILTGSMLRLGVSLPCVDIAFNFDGIKSIDLNYQTMFRVLTERKGKEYGYYFDFYPERAIQFLYDYNEYYGKPNENKGQTITNIQSLLYLFNYNGLSISSGNTIETLNLYNSLIDKLEINNESLNAYYITDIKERIKKILDSLGDIPILNELAKYQLEDMKKVKVKHIMKKGKKKDVEKIKPIDIDSESDDEGDDDSDELIEDIDTDKITEFLSTYIPLIALFSYENRCSGEDQTFIHCIDNIIEDISKNVDTSLQEYCKIKCADINEPLACYMDLVYNFNKNKFINSLKTIKSTFTNEKYKSNEKIKKLKNTINNIFVSIRDTMGKKKNLITQMTTKDIQDKIEEYLPVKKEEKDAFGEVFTPQILIEEMLDKLPKSVWKNPDFKWLDPANGIGNFPMIAFEKLNEGLKDVDGYKDENKRKEHIIKNMLYMVELNPKNVAVSRKIFGKDANIYCGSFLEDGWKEAFGIDKFDVIMGNPPFNDEKDGKRKGTNSGSKTLWDKFVLSSLEVLNINGFLTFIHPANWRGLGSLHKIWELLSNKQLLYLRIFGKKDGRKYFDIGSRFDIYVLQNKENTKPTEVIDELGEKHLLELNKMPFLPNYAYKEIDKILTSEDKGIDVIYDTIYHTQYKMNKTKTSEYKYPVVHSITQDGLTYWYSNDNTKGHFGVPKVILNFNEHQYSHPEQNDYEGKYGMSQISFGIPIKSKREGDLILKAIQTPKFKNIIAATKWGAFQTDYRMFKNFKPDFYKFFLDGKTTSSKLKFTRKHAKPILAPKKTFKKSKDIKSKITKKIKSLPKKKHTIKKK